MGPKALSDLQNGGRSRQRGYFLAVFVAACLVGCGGSSEKSADVPFATDAGSYPIAIKMDAANGFQQPFADAAAYFLAVDGAMAVPPPSAPPPPPGTCAVQTTTLYPRPAEVLLALDRSTAMAPLIASAGTSKWAATIAGVESAVLASQDATAWGLMLFPKSTGDSTCCQMPADDLSPTVEVAPTAQSAPSISAVLAQDSPAGVGTPTARALIQAANYLAARSTSTSKYLILATGGEPTCASDGLCSGAASTDYARTKDAVTHVASVLDIPVAVVAVALPTASNSYQPSVLLQLFTDLANLGGMPNTTPGQRAFYAIASASDLATALGTLNAQMTSCSFALRDPIVWPDDVAVLLSENRIARDTSRQDGWDYGDNGTSIVLYGKPCDDARSLAGGASLSFVTACPAVAIN